MLVIEKNFYLDQAVQDSRAAIEILEEAFKQTANPDGHTPTPDDLEVSLKHLQDAMEDARYLLNNSIKTIDNAFIESKKDRAAEKKSEESCLTAVG